MPTFGFSAFLKLLSLNDRPQRREVRSRLTPSKGGYDFHRSLKLGIKHLIERPVAIEDVLNSLRSIERAPERKSALRGIEDFVSWRRLTHGELVQIDGTAFESPSGQFKVSFEPQFGLREFERLTAVHVYNTARPRLNPRMTRLALSLVSSAYRKNGSHKDDVAILNLRERELIRLGHGEDVSVPAKHLLEGMDALFQQIRRDIDGFRPPLPRPPAPPPI